MGVDKERESGMGARGRFVGQEGEAKPMAPRDGGRSGGEVGQDFLLLMGRGTTRQEKGGRMNKPLGR